MELSGSVLRRLFRVAGVVCLCWMGIVVAARSAFAETPILETTMPSGDYGLFEDENVPYIPQPWFMWFVLGELSSAEDVDMARFDYRAGDRFRAVIFIPAHDELRDFNPTIALIGPGLPEPPQGSLPLELPSGMGAITATSESTYVFFDIFTQMPYFPRAVLDVKVPQTGRYYVAVWGEPVGMARYALDVGLMEDLALTTLVRYPVNWWEVRDFLRWGHWPIVFLPPLLALGAVVWLRRRMHPRAFEHALPVVWLCSAAATVTLVGVQQVPGEIAQAMMAFGVGGLVAVMVLGAVVWGAYLLTPLRERYNLREFAKDDRFVWVDGYAVHYLDDGPKHAPAVVLIHGFASSAFTWRLLREALLAQGFRVLIVELLGYGASARPAEPIYTTEMQARVVLGAMEQLGVHAAHCVGHSFGGRVAMQMALLAPSRVCSLVVIAPEAFATDRPPIAYALRVPVLGYVLAFYSTSPIFTRPVLHFISRQRAWITNAVVRGYAAPLYVRASALAQLWQGRSPKDGVKPVPYHLKEIAHPTLIIWGANDVIFPVNQAYRLAEILPHAQLHVLPETGHLPHEEQPDEVARLVIAFLRHYGDALPRSG